MKTTTTHRRCVECSGEFIADPRVGDRQVTCGAEGCQRTRHAGRGREWHAGNAEGRGGWGRSLREIREQTGLLGGAILGRLQALVSGAEQLLARAAGT